MPAKSKSQQRLFGLIHALKQGKVSADDVSSEVQDVAASISDKDAADFARTKHKGLPTRVKEGAMTFSQYLARGESNG